MDGDSSSLISAASLELDCTCATISSFVSSPVVSNLSSVFKYTLCKVYIKLQVIKYLASSILNMVYFNCTYMYMCIHAGISIHQKEMSYTIVPESKSMYNINF